MDIAKEYIGLMSGNVWTWGVGILVVVLTLPASLLLLDPLTQMISDLILALNEKVTRHLPKFIREPLQRRMLRTVKKGIANMQGIVSKIRG